MSAYIDYIEQVDSEIRKAIKEEHLVSDVPSFCGLESNTKAEESNDVSKLQRSSFYIHLLENEEILYDRKIISHQRHFSKLVIFCKQIIRKLVRFLIEPIVRDINQTCMTLVSALEEMNQYLLLHANEKAQIESALIEIVELKEENRRLQDEIGQLRLKKD